MVHTPSRRALLASVGTGATALLAGCAGDDSTGTTTDKYPGERIAEYTVEFTRSTGDRPPVVAVSADDGTTAGDRAGSTPDPTRSLTLAERDDADAVEFAPDARNVAAVRRLLAETGFTDECVFLYQTTIRECYRLKLNYVSRDADGDPNLDFCTVIRDADTACEQDSRDYVATFVRLPFPSDEVGGYSIGRGSSCDPGPGDGGESG
jgi:hypothetical protein